MRTRKQISSQMAAVILVLIMALVMASQSAFAETETGAPVENSSELKICHDTSASWQTVRKMEPVPDILFSPCPGRTITVQAGYMDGENFTAENVTWTTDLDEEKANSVKMTVNSNNKSCSISFNDYKLLGDIVTLTATTEAGKTAACKVALNTEKLYFWGLTPTDGIKTIRLMPERTCYGTIFFGDGFRMEGYEDEKERIQQYIVDHLTITCDNEDVLEITKLEIAQFETYDTIPAMRFYFKTKTPGSAVIKAVFEDGEICAKAEHTYKVLGGMLSSTYLGLQPGETARLTYTDVTGKKTVWSSSDESIVTVDQNGLVTAIGNGTATITASDEEGTYQDTCAVYSYKDGIHIDGEPRTEYTWDASQGDTLWLSAYQNCTRYTQDYWFSSNTDIATITSGIQVEPNEDGDGNHAINNGKVTFKKNGTVTFYAVRNLKDEKFPVMGTCTITVTGFDEDSDMDKGWKTVTSPQYMNTSTTQIQILDHQVETQSFNGVYFENRITDQIKANAFDFTLKLHTSSAHGYTLTEEQKQEVIDKTMPCINIYKVNEDGSRGDKVASYQNGYTLKSVTYETESQTTHTFHISVDKGVLKKGQKYVLVADATTPSYCKDVSRLCLYKEACYEFTTQGAAQSITIDKEKLDLDPGRKISLNAVLNPDQSAEADDMVVWLSSDETVATVDQEGTVTAVKAGTAEITAMAVDGKVTASCKVNVGGTESAAPTESEKPTAPTAAKKAISKATVSSIANKAYTGKAIKPAVTVKVSGKTLKNGTDYTATYKNNIKPGKATITIKGKGDYTGTKTVTFNIKPKKAAVSKLTSTKKAVLKVTWKKDATATGYQVVIAKNKAFTSGKKTANIKKNTTTSKTFTKLTRGKTYYAKVRAYKSISGKKVYGTYSAVKSKKVKK